MKLQLKHYGFYVLTVLVIMSWSYPSESASAAYYYLHVASFRSQKSATDSVKYLKRNNVSTVIRKENIPIDVKGRQVETKDIATTNRLVVYGAALFVLILLLGRVSLIGGW